MAGQRRPVRPAAEAGLMIRTDLPVAAAGSPAAADSRFGCISRCLILGAADRFPQAVL
jgi:hypothetical protein